MVSLIKQVLIVLLSFSESLTTKCMFLDDKPYMVRPTLIDLNPVEPKYYSFMISLDTLLSLIVGEAGQIANFGEKTLKFI